MTLVFFKPTTAVAKNAGESSENMLEWTITPAQGIVFTPTDVSLTACTAGGTGDPQISIYAVYSDNTVETIQTKTNPNRPDKTGTNAPSTYTKTLASAVSGKFVVRAYFQGLTNTGKGAAITNVVISGKVSGTPVATTTYTITVETNDATLGSVSGTSTVAENEQVTITATPTTAGYFSKWLKDNADFDGNTVNPLTVTATANATYTAVFESKKVISFEAGEGSGTVPSTVYLMSGEDYTIPESYFLYKSGATLAGWNDGITTHEIGATLSNVTEDMVLTAQFTDNTVNLGDSETTVNWTFARNSGAPTLTCENSELDYVQHTTINNTRYDAVMHVDTRKDQVIDGRTGKLNNTSDAAKAQVNKGTKFTVPVIDGSVISYTITNGTLEASSVTFGGNNGTVSGNVISYTYSGEVSTLDVIDVTGGFYPSGITVTYPIPQTKYTTPSIVVDNFNFANKGYKVIITANEGTLQVSTDGTTYSEQASPYVTYATATTTYYAKATGNDYEDSDVAEEEVTNPYDVTKKFVAWVYESNYKNAPNNYAIASDVIYTGLGASYNVVTVDIKDYNSAITDEQKAALTGNLENADLVVISEAAAGSSKAVIALKDLVGNVPLLNMKLFAYTYNSDASKNRWGWGTPKNAAKDVVSVTPVSKLYKVLEGVSFTDSDVALFDYPNEQNHIQYVDSWQAEPEGDVVIALSGEKPAIHVSNTLKYFGIGLSCDDFTKYNANAVTIVKNAAAMLITGEDLAAIIIPEPSDPEIQGDVVTLTTTTTMQGWRAFYDAYNSYTLDNNTKAYVATEVKTEESVSKVVLTEIAAVYQGAAVLLKTTNQTADGYSMTLTKDNTILVPDLLNQLKPASDATYNKVYRLGSKNGEVGFFPYAPEAGKPDVVVLNYDASNASGARGLTFSFADDETTAIQNVNGNDNVNKNVYDLQGRRVAKPTKGMYIVNGKKVIIK